MNNKHLFESHYEKELGASEILNLWKEQYDSKKAEEDEDTYIE